MDLGFGTANQNAGQQIAGALLQSAKIQEQILESELDAYDALLNDDTGLEQLRQKRIREMKKQHEQKEKWKAQGHGSYAELEGCESKQGNANDVAKAFFKACKESQFVVIHFYRDSSSALCDIFHKHCAALAMKHLETKFVKINVENCDTNDGNAASYLVEKLGIVVMPTLLLVKDQKSVHQIRGFHELGNSENFSTNALAFLLNKCGVLPIKKDDEYHYEEEFLDEINRINKGVNTINMNE